MNTLKEIIEKLIEIFSTIDVQKTTTTQEGMEVGYKTFSVKSIEWKKNLDYRLYTVKLLINFGNIETFIDLYTDEFEHQLAHYFEVDAGMIENDKGLLNLTLKTNW